MKRVIWFAGIAWAISAAQNAQAIPGLTPSLALAARGTLTAATTATAGTRGFISGRSRATTPSTTSTAVTSRLLASLIPKTTTRAGVNSFDDHTFATFSRSYAPAPIIKNPQPTGSSSSSSSGQAGGGKTNSSNVPDGGATAGLLGLSLAACGWMTRKFRMLVD